MRIISTKNYNEASARAADLIAAQILVKPDSVLGLATGSTPIGTYKELVKKYNNSELSFSEVSTINLDEYVGLGHDDEQSYYHFMMENLHNKTDIDKNNVYLPNGLAENIDDECIRYEELAEDLGIDIQLLGIGLNGHVGFNEPSDFIENYTYKVELTQSTIEANKRFFKKAEDVPKEAITMGIGTIMRAKKLVLLITGENKAEILDQALFGPITPQVPASLIRMHPDLTVIADNPALKLVSKII